MERLRWTRWSHINPVRFGCLKQSWKTLSTQRPVLQYSRPTLIRTQRRSKSHNWIARAAASKFGPRIKWCDEKLEWNQTVRSPRSRPARGPTGSVSERRTNLQLQKLNKNHWQLRVPYLRRRSKVGDPWWPLKALAPISYHASANSTNIFIAAVLLTLLTSERLYIQSD